MEILLVIPLLILSGFFSGSETAIYSMSTVRLDYLTTQGQWRARLIRWLRSPLGPTIITILIANNIVAEMLARLTEQNLAPLGAWSVVVATLVLTPLVLIFGEFLPKWLARTQSDRLIYQVALVLVATRWLLVVPVWVCQGITALLHRMIPGKHAEIWVPHSSRPNLRTFIRSPENRLVIGDAQQRLIDRILALERLTLAYERVTRPLESVHMLDARSTISSTLPTLGPKFYQHYLIGFPVTRQAVGWISAQDIAVADPQTRLRDVARPLARLPSTTPLQTALQHMQRDGAEMVLVTDGYGRPTRVAFRGDCLRVLMNVDAVRLARNQLDAATAPPLR